MQATEKGRKMTNEQTVKAVMARHREVKSSVGPEFNFCEADDEHWPCDAYVMAETVVTVVKQWAEVTHEYDHHMLWCEHTKTSDGGWARGGPLSGQWIDSPNLRYAFEANGKLGMYLKSAHTGCFMWTGFQGPSPLTLPVTVQEYRDDIVGNDE